MPTGLRKRVCLPCVGLAAAMVLGVVAPYVRGADPGCEAEMKQNAVATAMMEVKSCARDDAKRHMLGQELAKAMVIQQMASATCSDEKCKMMLSSDPDLTHLVADAKAILSDKAQMAKLQHQVMSDPKQMQAVIIQALAVESTAPAKQ